MTEKDNNLIFLGWRTAILAGVFVLCSLLEPAYCQGNDPALLLQQTPAQGGTITPDAGVHHFDLNTELTLTAVPKPGYQFVYWLGDVSNPTANSTICYLDAPKIIIAVFERVEFEFLPVQAMSQSAPHQGLRLSAADYTRQGYSGGGSKRPGKIRPPGEILEDFPVPGDGEANDFPVPEPIPEPATVVLLGLSSLLAFTRRRAKRPA